MAISLRRRLPAGSSTLPAPRRTGVGSLRCPGLLGLARGGVCLAIAVTNDPVRSYRTFSPLLWEGAEGRRGQVMPCVEHLAPWPLGPFPKRFVSVALSLLRSSPTEAVGVTHHRVLSCSDFPRDRASPIPRPSRPRHVTILLSLDSETNLFEPQRHGEHGGRSILAKEARQPKEASSDLCALCVSVVKHKRTTAPQLVSFDL